MKKDLAEKITNKIKRDRKSIREELELDSFDFRKSLIELQNLLILKEYPIFSYDEGLLLTDIEGYRKENNIPEEMSDEEVRLAFARKYKDRIRKFEASISAPITESDIAIHRLMTTESKYKYLKDLQYRIKTLLDERDNLYATIPGNEFMHIKTLEALEEDQVLYLDELLDLKNRIQLVLPTLPRLQDVIINYSPDFYRNVLNEDYENHVERLNAIFNLFHLSKQDPMYRVYDSFYQEFKPLYKEYQSLKMRAHFSKKAKARSQSVVNMLIAIYHEIVNLLSETITEREQALSNVFGQSFMELTTPERIDTIDYYYRELCKIKSDLDDIIEDLSRQRDFKDGQIEQILIELREKTGIVVRNAVELATKDPFDSYKKVDYRSQAKTLENLSMKEIIESYGHVSDAYVYRIMPTK